MNVGCSRGFTSTSIKGAILRNLRSSFDRGAIASRIVWAIIVGCAIGAVFIRAYRLQLVIGAFVALITGYVVEVLSARKGMPKEKARTASDVDIGALVVEGDALELFDNWDAKRTVSVPCSPGTYRIILECTEPSKVQNVRAIRLVGPGSSPKKSARLSVDTGAIFIADRTLLASGKWNPADTEERTLAMFEAETGPHFAQWTVDAGHQAIVIATDDGDGMFEVASHQEKDRFVIDVREEMTE